ncbi:MAG: glycosyltransferase family 2 protein [Deltaproteobacteria bacterium]|nr:glycosyltransferase family 2 protein [Deltaproteobacteria bacterium]
MNFRMISVIIPTFNRSEILARVLPSYLSQSDLLEVILVDDSNEERHCTNNQNLVRGDTRLILFQNHQRLGLTVAKNRGVQLARGDFIFFGEDDAILSSDHFKILLDHQRVDDADIIGGRKIYLRSEETVEEAIERARHTKGKHFDLFFMEFRCEQAGDRDIPAPFLQTSSLIRRSIFEAVQFDESYVGFVKGYCWREETDFYMSAHEKGFRIVFCPHVIILNLPIHSGGTHLLSDWQKELWIWKNNFYLLKKHKKHIRHTLGNPFPILILEIAYLLRRLYHRLRNHLWSVLCRGQKK